MNKEIKFSKREKEEGGELGGVIEIINQTYSYIKTLEDIVEAKNIPIDTKKSIMEGIENIIKNGIKYEEYLVNLKDKLKCKSSKAIYPLFLGGFRASQEELKKYYSMYKKPIRR